MENFMLFLTVEITMFINTLYAARRKNGACKIQCKAAQYWDLVLRSCYRSRSSRWTLGFSDYDDPELLLPTQCETTTGGWIVNPSQIAHNERVSPTTLCVDRWWTRSLPAPRGLRWGLVADELLTYWRSDNVPSVWATQPQSCPSASGSSARTVTFASSFVSFLKPFMSPLVLSHSAIFSRRSQRRHAVLMFDGQRRRVGSPFFQLPLKAHWRSLRGLSESKLAPLISCLLAETGNEKKLKNLTCGTRRCWIKHVYWLFEPRRRTFKMSTLNLIKPS